MASRVNEKEKERTKAEQDKLQSILNELLKDEDNKYCADCDAKGKLSATQSFLFYLLQHFRSFWVLDGLRGILVFLFVFDVLEYIEISASTSQR